jgi:hypothetical protein
MKKILILSIAIIGLFSTDTKADCTSTEVVAIGGGKYATNTSTKTTTTKIESYSNFYKSNNSIQISGALTCPEAIYAKQLTEKNSISVLDRYTFVQSSVAVNEPADATKAICSFTKTIAFPPQGNATGGTFTNLLTCDTQTVNNFKIFP